MKNGCYYIAYAYDDDSYEFSYCFEFDNYKEALKTAIEEQKSEIEFQRYENKRCSKDSISSTYVIYYEDGYFYEMAVVSGWRCKVTEYEYY